MDNAVPNVPAFEIAPSVRVGSGEKLLLIAGPCQIESLEHSLMIAGKLKELCDKLPLNLVFKASFDKANRTALKSERGVGIDRGLQILSEVRNKFKIPVLTDIHSPEQAFAAAEVVDILQTPAFLCRQTDLLVAAGKTGKTVNIKKGQFLHPLDMRFSAEKVASHGNRRLLLCERGTSFGYRDLVVDMRSLVLMRTLGYPIIFDATHSVQQLGGEGGVSGGSSQFVEALVRAAVSVGIDGIFMECHEKPERAPSDGASMLTLTRVPALLETICRLRASL